MSHTPRPKSVAFAFLLGTFLTGAAVGFAADRAMGRADASLSPVSQNDEQAMRDSLAKQLSLSSAQREVVDSVLDWRRAQYREVMKRNRPGMDSARDSARVLMMRVMDSSQIVAFKTLIERNRRAADSASRARENKK